MIRVSRRSVLLLTLSAVLLWPATSEPAEVEIDSLLYWYAVGTANPELTYYFQSFNTAQILKISTPELLQPAVLTGYLRQNGSLRRPCSSGSVAAKVGSFNCWIPSSSTEQRYGCPTAEGVWQSIAQFTLLTQTWQRSSQSVFANCPPVCTPIPTDPNSPFPYLRADESGAESPVSPRFKPSLVTGIDLSTGLEIERDVAVRIPRGSLHRVEKHHDTTFVLDEPSLPTSCETVHAW